MAIKTNNLIVQFEKKDILSNVSTALRVSMPITDTLWWTTIFINKYAFISILTF